MSELRSVSVRPVVVAVDDDLAASLIQATLIAAGYLVVRAAHGAQVLKVVNQHHSPLVILDLHTTRRTGREIMRQLRARSVLAMTHVLALSLTRQKSAADEARADGADEFLLRPFNPRDLLASVCRLYAVPAVA